MIEKKPADGEPDIQGTPVNPAVSTLPSRSAAAVAAPVGKEHGVSGISRNCVVIG
jgi:hypothetical protein